jgi:sterol desaturase/sphingolipid hydroxylase (fatty acid hydroxylase superfamily)
MCLYIMLGMHAINITEAVCSMTYLDKIFCGCICIIGFFFFELAALNYMIVTFSNSSGCKATTPYQYWWLGLNLVVYFFFVLIACYFHIRSLCGSPDEEDKKTEAE